MPVNRKLLEAQVEFGMFPESAFVTDVQEAIIQDAVAQRVAQANLAEGRSQPKGPRPVKRVMQALATTLRAEPTRGGMTLWQCACEKMALNEVEGAEFDLNAEQSAELCATYDKNGCGDVAFSIGIEINGKRQFLKARTLYDYFMKRVKT